MRAHAAGLVIGLVGILCFVGLPPFRGAEADSADTQVASVAPPVVLVEADDLAGLAPLSPPLITQSVTLWANVEPLPMPATAVDGESTGTLSEKAASETQPREATLSPEPQGGRESLGESVVAKPTEPPAAAPPVEGQSESPAPTD